MKKTDPHGFYRLTAAFLFILTFSSCRHQPSVTTFNPKDTLLLYLMAGQSNMAGRGAIEPQDTVSDLRILSLDSGNQFVVAKEPLHFYQPAIAGLDCGMSFAQTLLKLLPANTKIGLIPCAVGSTGIEDWLNDSVRIIPLYTNLITRARAGMQHGVIKGILWHQGEHNAADSGAFNYGANMQVLIRRLRQDVGDDVPVFMGKLGSFSKLPYAPVVNAALDETAKALPKVYVIETAGLSCRPDSLHFDAAAQRELGIRFAHAAAQLLK